MGIRSCLTASRKLLLFLASSALITALLYIAFRAHSIFYPHAGVTTTQDQVAFAYNNTRPETRTRYIPRIIHQIFLNRRDAANETIPATWDAARQSCISLHKDWEYKLWTEKPSRDFIKKEYPWFLRAYDGFTFPEKRADALRYFLMRYYGGIYIDLDIACQANLEPLLYYPAWLTDRGHGSLSNNVLGSLPNHPFWKYVTESLLRYSRNSPFSFLAASFAPGKWFLIDAWQRYHAGLSEEDDRLTRVMMDSRPGSAPWIFFTYAEGGSQSNKNHELLLPRVLHLFTLMCCTAAIFAAAVFIAVGPGNWWLSKTYWARRRCRHRHFDKNICE
ncbi:glycosyl transferase sugar-binding region (DXD) protein [Metarhizium robertsii]|uniref:Glycosyl transferase sugar-binding region (DXD) protein n=1 Tax=Metarhizium robertsii TaxID=568076 RepID=A0A014QYY3_9HYPO|nr:glycosyl transferase sugar-binding region (DXD) protein [Metarhizium robertsii]